MDNVLTQELGMFAFLEANTEEVGGMVFSRSSAMSRIARIVAALAPHKKTVLITGDVGTGKEKAARALHALSYCKGREFHAINCACIDEGTAESILFGHKKGAFTGAASDHKGIFREGSESTVFLDEITGLTPKIQHKLLRVLQEQQVFPLGEDKPLAVNARIIAASNEKMENLVKNGKFRSDLFDRLNVFRIRIPSLAERPDDIPILAYHFWKKFTGEIVDFDFPPFDEFYSEIPIKTWKGNVRELENFIERKVLSLRTGVDLMDTEYELSQSDTHREEFTDLCEAALKKDFEFLTLKEARLAFDRYYLNRILTHCGGNAIKAAEIADRYKSDFYELLKSRGISLADYKTS